MANKLFQELNRNVMVNDGGFAEMMQRLQQFKQNFRGNAKDEVQRLLNSGQMTQAQYNQLTQMTNEIVRTIFK